MRFIWASRYYRAILFWQDPFGPPRIGYLNGARVLRWGKPLANSHASSPPPGLHTARLVTLWDCAGGFEEAKRPVRDRTEQSRHVCSALLPNIVRDAAEFEDAPLGFEVCGHALQDQVLQPETGFCCNLL